MYKKMYFHLFNAITEALDENELFKAKEILIQAQIETEEIYINYDGEKIIEIN